MCERRVETCESTAHVSLSNFLKDGTTIINSDISQDGQHHYHPRLLKDYIKTWPFASRRTATFHRFNSTTT